MLVVFCGIDGSGKSTIIASLIDRLSDLPVEATRKNNKSIQDIVTGCWKGEQVWHQGPFAQCVAIASCYDFLHYYQTELKTRIEVNQGKVLLSDRFDICYHAFTHSVEGSPDVSPLFENVITPDLLFYICIDVNVLIDRYAMRGGAGPDETLEVMQAFDKSYVSLLSSYKCQNTYIIDNTGPLGESIDKVETIIRSCYDEFQ